MRKRSNDCFVVDYMSASSEVTGSCTYFTVRYPDHRTEHFIVDCGLFQEKEYDNLNSEILFDPKKVDYALITHNHIDHIGKLPFLVKKGFYAPICTTEETKELMPLALYDTASIFNSDSKKRGVKPLYSETDVSKTLKLVHGFSYEIPIKVSKNVTATFFPNGHLVGSSIILLQIEFYGFNTINILITGDYDSKNSFFEVNPLPKWVTELPLYLICESTYGYMDSSSVNYCFENNLREFFKNHNGTAVLPVLSLGRAQLILQKLKSLQASDSIFKNIPIFLDGKLTIQYTKLFLSGLLNLSKDTIDFLPDNLRFVDKTLRPSLMGTPGKKIIVTSSGMGSNGPAQTYIQQYIKREDSLIHFTCYCANGTMGRQIAETDKNEVVLQSGLVLYKRANVKFTSEFSSHAKKDELLSFLKQFKDLQLVCVTHGQSQVKEEFSKEILQQVETKNVGVLSRDYYFRIKSSGAIETHTTHFNC